MDDLSLIKFRKQLIAELLSGESDRSCPIDDCFDRWREIREEDDWGKLSEKAIQFILVNEKKLRRVHESGQIAFFKRCDYEKIINEYVPDQHTTFNRNGHSKGSPRVPQKEKTREAQPGKNKSSAKTSLEIDNSKRTAGKQSQIPQEEDIQFVLDNIGNFRWDSVVFNKRIHYTAQFKNKTIRFIKNRTDQKDYSLSFNERKIPKDRYDPEDLETKIVSVMLQDLEHEERGDQHRKVRIIIRSSRNSASNEPKEERQHKRDDNEHQRAEKNSKEQEEQEAKKIEKELQLERERQAALKLQREKEIKYEKERQAKLKREQEGRRQIPQIGYQDFVVHSNVFRCVHKNHSIEDVSAAVSVITRSNEEILVLVHAGYCRTCRTFFIMEDTYEALKRKGVILCRISDEKNYYKKYDSHDMQLANESLLMQYGYNVKQSENLSDTERQKILAVLIDKKIMTRSEIISYLNFFICQRRSRSMYQIAVRKWEDDRRFVERYRLGDLSIVNVQSITRKNDRH